MSEAQRWLETRIANAPADLRARMMGALADTHAASIADTLAEAAWRCLRRTLRNPAQRASAFDLLAADALLTHACEAAAQAGPQALADFTETWNAARFEQLLPSKVP